MKWIWHAALCAVIALLPLAGGAQEGNQIRDGAPGTAQRDASTTTVRGVVRAVDARNGTITLRPEASNGGPTTERDIELLYNESTVVEYQGKTYNNPQNIEVGDRVEAQFSSSGWRVVKRFVVLRNVWDDTQGERRPPAGEGQARAPQDEARNGAVRYDGRLGEIDTRRRSFQLIQGSREDFPVNFVYDDDTRIERRGQSVRVDALRDGDIVQVTAVASQRGLLATRIAIDEPAGGAAPQPVPEQAAVPVRGVIRKVDARMRTFEFESKSRLPNAAIRRGMATVQYDRMTSVEYQGKRYTVQNLEPGDEVDVQVTRIGEDVIADRIVVVKPR